MSRKVNRSSKTGKFVDQRAAAENPSEIVTETISPAADLIRHVREFLKDDPANIDHWREVLKNDLARIEGK